MLRVALALGLLVTPAIAQEYTQDDCALIEELFDNCKTKCEAFQSPAGAKAYRQMADRHMNWDGNEFDRMCANVCKGKVLPTEALDKYCPAGWRRL
jgi:hypothetical protein